MKSDLLGFGFEHNNLFKRAPIMLSIALKRN